MDALSFELLVDELVESLELATLELELELDTLDASLDDELAEEGTSSLELASLEVLLEELSSLDTALDDELLDSDDDDPSAIELDDTGLCDDGDELLRLDDRDVLCPECLEAKTPEVTLVFTPNDGLSDVRRNVKVAEASLDA
ncbi:hypothetical protein ACRCJN_08715, partial [Aerococcus urinaeequi]|uniref:hypothetical protein n=1 Tax=Aerococcus urinaeequi TaxID=51665 RepID=UPI003D6B09C3